jgi:hypothetical protein
MKEGRSIPCAFIASIICGPWFHSAAATKSGEPNCLKKSRFGPTTPPEPPTWWQVMQRFSAKYRAPTFGLPGASK